MWWSTGASRYSLGTYGASFREELAGGDAPPRLFLSELSIEFEVGVKAQAAVRRLLNCYELLFLAAAVNQLTCHVGCLYRSVVPKRHLDEERLLKILRVLHPVFDDRRRLHIEHG